MSHVLGVGEAKGARVRSSATLLRARRTKPDVVLLDLSLRNENGLRVVETLIKELPHMELEGSVIKQVHAVTGRYDLIAFVESPDLQSLGN